MIFITLGTHEQPFDRIIGEVNRLIADGTIKEDVFMQAGYHYNIKPACDHVDFLSMAEMDKYMTDASIVITHGGLGSIIQTFINNRIPIVVPRQMKYGEHVDDHQVFFSSRMERDNKIIRVIDIEDLGRKITGYDLELARLGIKSDPGKSIEERSRSFSGKLDSICLELVKKSDDI